MKSHLRKHKPKSKSLPSEGGSSPLSVIGHNKRGRGRPKGSKNKREDEKEKEKGLLNPKALTVLKNVAADTEKLNELTVLVAPENDGGGTHENSPTITKESLERRISRRLNVLDRYLTDDRLHQLLMQSTLKEIGVYEGIMMDKSLVLKGQPTVIIGNADRAEIDNVLPRLLTEIKRRGLITTARERSIEFRGTGSYDPDAELRSRDADG